MLGRKYGSILMPSNICPRVDQPRNRCVSGVSRLPAGRDLPLLYCWRRSIVPMERLNAPKSGMTIMAQPNPFSLPEATETQQLRAEIQRMADMVSGVVRQTAIDGINAGM